MATFTYMFLCYEYSKGIKKKKEEKKFGMVKEWQLVETKKKHTMLYSTNKANRLQAFPQIVTYEYLYF